MNSTDITFELVYGHSTPAASQLYVRALGPAEWFEGSTLSGKVVGPSCRHTHTLVAPFELHDQGANPTPLAHTTVTEPTFWTPSLPMTYQVDWTLSLKDGTSLQGSRAVGIRRFGSNQGAFWMDGNRTVLRAIALDEVHQAEWDDLRTTGTVVVTRHPTEALMTEALHQGVLLVWDARDLTDEQVVSPFDGAIHWPGISLVLTRQMNVQQRFASLLPVVSVVRHLDHHEQIESNEQAEAICCASDHPSILSGEAAHWPVPVIVVEEAPAENRPIAGRRNACDLLQARLASKGQFDGYFV